MNCEKCQDLISEFLDGSITHQDKATLSSHFDECLQCADVRDDLNAIVGFCRTQRGQYDAPPNERALWLRIRNMIEAGADLPKTVPATPRRNFWSSWTSRSWELSFSQLAALFTAIVVIVSLATVVGLKRWQSGAVDARAADGSQNGVAIGAKEIRHRMTQQQQLISYWNQRVEFNKARWNPQMRETFDRNLAVIDQAINDSYDSLSKNPNDEVSQEMLNTALNEKLSLLKEFSEL
ncbi:MAG TPA: zf-HC2 domain-containing protein [Pyrinomonadaceae bacterium]|nr:zf-HC2 domain-containing protein [Pyrinomonadaceae bacterium]